MELSYLQLTGVFAIILTLVGFFRSQIDGKKPDSILSLNDIAIAWLSDNTWKSRLSILLLPFVFVYNLLAWLVHGLSSVAEFLAFLIHKLWDFLLIIWHEILNPSLIWTLKLIWHYPLGFIWRFFEYSFSNVKTALNLQSILFSLRWLLWLALLGSLLIIPVLLLRNTVILGVGGIIFLMFLIYAMFQIVSRHRPDKYAKDKIPGSMLMVFIWFSVTVAAGFLLVLLAGFEGYIIKALGVSLGQIIIPVSVLLAIAFISAATCLPAYYQGKDGMVNTLDYLKELLKRVPKLLYAQPFQLFGGLLVGIVPFAIVFGLNAGVGVISGKDLRGWMREVATMGVHIPNIQENKAEINAKSGEIANIQKEIEAANSRFKSGEEGINARIKEAQRLRDQIRDNKIHTFSGDAYVGEEQFFSVPYINNCAEYKWVIEKGGKKIAGTSVAAPADGESVVLYYRWTSPGAYTVKLTPSNRCGNSQVLERNVTVLEVPPGKKSIKNPTGKALVCENEEAVYQTQGGYTSYEWRFPDGTQTTSKPQLKITWGRTSGTVQVRGLKDGQEPTLWRGIDVEVQVLPGSPNPDQAYLSDEQNPEFLINRDFIYKTREEADDAIRALEDEKADLKSAHNAEIQGLKAQIKNLEAEIGELLNKNKQENRYLVGKIIAVFGLALAAVLLFSTLFTYLPLYHFDVYTFRDAGEHYWEQTLAALRLRNPHQPLLGFFLLIPLILLALFLYQGALCWFAGECIGWFGGE